MPLIKPTFKPGVNRENTRYKNEGGWYESQWVRFRQGSPEKIGGWTQFSPSTFLGVCRTLWNWVTLANVNLIAVGTNLKFYLTFGNIYYDITPIRSTVTLGTNPFATTGGSNIVTVTSTANGVGVNDFVTFSGATAVAGLSMNGQFQVLNVVNANSYTVTANGSANTTTTGGGSAVVAAYQLNTGPASQTPYIGWGAGSWGSGTWGTGSGTKNNLQLWNAFNFGENLLFGPRGGGIYYWVAGGPTAGITNVSNRGVALNTTGGTVTITIASPAVVTSSVTLPNGSSLTLGTTGALPTGLTAGTTYYVVNVSGTTFNLATTSGGTPINTSGSQSGVQSIATLLDVPIFQNSLLVSDASNFVIVFGTNALGTTTIDPMQIRWSDQQNPLVWYPDVTNQAGDVRLSHGSEIITYVQTRQEIVTFTDQAVYSLQYLGPPYVWGTQLLSENTSIMGPNAAVLASGIVYWMGVDKFYYYNGTVQTLNCDLRRYVFQNINLLQNEQVYCSTVEGFNEVWWFYVSGTGTQVNAYVVYNYLEQTWYYGNLGRTAWLDTTLQSNPVAATYNGYLVNQESGLDNQEFGPNNTQPIDAYISSSEFDVSDQTGSHFAFISLVLPDLTFENSTAINPTTTMTIEALINAGSGITQTYPNPVYSVNINGDPETFTGYVYTRIRGRQFIFRMESNQLGTAWQLGAPRFDARPDGRR